MYSEYAFTHFTQSMQRTCFLYRLSTLYNVHIDSQLYFVIYIYIYIYIYKMCVRSKCGLCTLYSVQCTFYSVHIACILHICVISLLFTF